MNTYQLTLTENQVRLTARALDLWDRICLGQQWALERELLALAPAANEYAVRGALDELWAVAFPDGERLLDSPGHDTAFNLRKVLEAAISWTSNPNGGMTVNFDGPISGWWEGEPAAVCLRYEGEEAVRVRDRANQTQRLGARLAELIGTEDIEEATKRVAEWKHKAEAYRA